MFPPNKYATSSLHAKPASPSRKSGMGPTQGPQNTAKLKEAWVTMPIKIGEGWGMRRWMSWLELGIAMRRKGFSIF